ncbi:glutamate receptor U1 [Eurytemora carolleeae]|uniref:glutamate receptor U1 n=1 Tax=Eurytemora carolleeae TaxID=1294199 RepID=UPI000C7561C0|nr:glutamate receptor U1 [Eurytemora carolleeae]|eukprot:XP_023348082.1 glutamate receptor U1-like [Eurytemora affinis]
MSILNYWKSLSNEKEKSDFMVTKHITVGSVVDVDPIHLTEKKNGMRIYKFGVLKEIFDAFSSTYNMSYNIIPTLDDSYGVDVGNGSFSGVIGMVQRKEVDVGGGIFSRMEERQKVVDFSAAIGVEAMNIMWVNVDLADTDYIIAPFTNIVWLYVLIAAFLMGPIMYIMINCFERNVLLDTPPQYIGLMNYYWFLYGALVKQGSSIVPSTDVMRILFLTWWIYITFLTAEYTAQLTANLTKNNRTLPIHHLQDMSSDPSFKWATPGNGSFQTMIDSWPDFVNLKNDIISGKGRYIGSADYKKEGKREGSSACTYSQLNKYTFGKVSLGLIFPKESRQLQEMFNKVLQKLLQSGLIEHSTDVTSPNIDLESACKEVVGMEPKKIFLYEVSMTFQMMLGGGIVAAIVFGLEILCLPLWEEIKLQMKGCKRFMREEKRRRRRLNKIHVHLVQHKI